MKYVNGNYHAEVKDERHLIHPIEDFILRRRKESNSEERKIKLKVLQKRDEF